MEQLSNYDWSEIGKVIGVWGLKVLGAVAVLALGWVALRALRGLVRRWMLRADVDETLIPFLTSLIYYIGLACLLIAVLGMFGVQTTSFIAVLGAAGLAVGLALQGTLSNFAAGVMLLIFRPFRVEDFVKAGGVTGKVEEIGIFSTTLNTPDNIRIIVPNSAVYGQTIENLTGNPIRRIDLVVGVSYDDDLGKASEVLMRVMKAHPQVLDDPEPIVAVHEMADSSVNLVARPWSRTEDYWAVRWALTREFKEQLEASGCSIPYPQRDVHLHRVES